MNHGPTCPCYDCQVNFRGHRQPYEVGTSFPSVSEENIPTWAKTLGMLDKPAPLFGNWGWWLAIGLGVGLVYKAELNAQKRRK